MSQQMKMELFKRIYSYIGRTLDPVEFKAMIRQAQEVS